MRPFVYWLVFMFTFIGSRALAGLGEVDREFKLPTVSHVQDKETVSSSQLEEEKIFKNTHQGDHEINPGLGLGYSSFSGLILQTSLSYRYFFLDNLSLGVMAESLFSQINREYGLGLTGRWYFYETDKWAYSLTQDFYYKEYNVAGSHYGQDGNDWKGKTGLRAHYFFTPVVNINFGLEYDYSIDPSRARSIEPSIDSTIGVGFNF